MEGLCMSSVNVLTCQQPFYLNEISALQECCIRGYTNGSLTLNTPKAEPISSPRVLEHPGHLLVGNSSPLILRAQRSPACACSSFMKCKR